MRELVYYVASTLDGFIAQDDGALDGFPWDDEYGAFLLESCPETFPAHLRDGELRRDDNRKFDAVLMGRKTYEVGLREGIHSPYPTLDQFVFSRSLQDTSGGSVEFVRNHAVEKVRALKQDDGLAIWLCGGAELAGLFMSEGLIDRLIVKLNPVIFGTGIPLFGPLPQVPQLVLEKHKSFASGHLILEYTVGG
mgnify:CR=1 FL=1